MAEKVTEKVTGKIAGGASGGWHDGFPVKKGWYDCQIEGVPIRLLLFVCEMSGRREWVTRSGDYVTDCGVVWRGEPGEA